MRPAWGLSLEMGPRRRKVVVTAAEEGALHERRLGRPSKTPPAFEKMVPTHELRFDPVFDPDPVEYLLSIGAPECVLPR